MASEKERESEGNEEKKKKEQEELNASRPKTLLMKKISITVVLGTYILPKAKKNYKKV